MTLPTGLVAADFAIATHQLSKRYGKTHALGQVNLRVPMGAVYLLVGPNGAGKSTMIKILLDLLRPTSGTADVLGLDPQHNPATVRANVGYVPEQLTWGYGWMRVGRLLEHHARYYPSWDREYAAHLAHQFQLRLDQRVGTLSKGQGRRVHLALALAHRPPLLILDEPTDGLDPVMRDDTMAVLIEHLANTPTTMLICTHHVSEFEQVADHIGVLRDSELRAQMTMTDLAAGLRRYRARIPEGWSGASLFPGGVLRRVTSARELDWTVWGEESEVIRALGHSGADIHVSQPLSLHDATLAMLNPRDEEAAR